MWTVLALAVFALGVAVVMFWAMQRTLLYFPDGRAVPPAAGALPGSEEAELRTADGLTLHAWFVPARSPVSATVLLLNGNAGNRSDRAPLASSLSAAGFAVLVFDYRGYGGNPGAPSETGLLLDARAALGYLASRDDVDPKRIVYYGESLGAAVAVALAAERPPLALILRSPFTSLADIGRHHYPYLPIHPRFLQDRYPSIDLIGAVRSPVLVIAGALDRVVPPDHSRRLYEAASEPKRFVLIPDGDHNDASPAHRRRSIDEVARFVRETR